MKPMKEESPVKRSLSITGGFLTSVSFMSLRNALDYFFCTYFALQIPTTLFLDTQTLFPPWMYAQWMRDIRDSYVADYRDPFINDTLSFPWFMAICVIEYSLEVPFFFVATYAYYKGAAKCPWIQLPALMYAVHTFTAVLGIIFSLALQDFSKFDVPGPRNASERFHLASMYCFFASVSLLIILDTCFSSVYKKKDTSIK